jgi:hypothetical protein
MRPGKDASAWEECDSWWTVSVYLVKMSHSRLKASLLAE